MTAPSKLQRLNRNLPGEPWQRYELRKARGEKSPMVDAARAQRHIDWLLGLGLTKAMIAAAANVDDEMIAQHVARNRTTMYRHYERAILAVSWRPHPAQRTVLTVGARRRCVALTMQGWSRTWQAEQTGIGGPNDLTLVLGKPRMSNEFWQRIAALYRDHSHLPGPSPRAVTWARKAGGVGPWAWDDDTIDDPTASPLEYERGARAELHRDDLADLVAGGASTEQLAARLGVCEQTVTRALRVHGLAAGPAPRRALTPEQEAEIVASDSAPFVLAVAYDVSVTTIRGVLRRARRTA